MKNLHQIKQKNLLVENELKSTNISIGPSYFFNDGAQVYLILQPLYYTLKKLGDTEKLVSCKSKSSLTKKITTPTTADNSLSPSNKWYENSNLCLKLKGGCLKQKKIQLKFLLIECIL